MVACSLACLRRYLDHRCLSTVQLQIAHEHLPGFPGQMMHAQRPASCAPKRPCTAISHPSTCSVPLFPAQFLPSAPVHHMPWRLHRTNACLNRVLRRAHDALNPTWCSVTRNHRVLGTADRTVLGAHGVVLGVCDAVGEQNYAVLGQKRTSVRFMPHARPSPGVVVRVVMIALKRAGCAVDLGWDGGGRQKARNAKR